MYFHVKLMLLERGFGHILTTVSLNSGETPQNEIYRVLASQRLIE